MIRRAARWLSAHRHAMWVFGDQAIVSGSNFAFGIAMARLLGIEGYGQWVLLYALVLYANTYAASLVYTPLLTALPKAEPGEESARLIRGTLTVQLLLALVLAGALMIGVTLADHYLPQWHGGGVVWPMALALVGFQLQDWTRRCFFAQRRGLPVVLSDLVAYGGQLAVVCLLGWARLLTVETAFLSLAGSYAAGFIVSMAQLRLRPSWKDGLEIMRSMWRTSRDYFLSWQFQWLGSQGVLFIGAGSLGVQSAGAIRAAQNLLGPTNVLFQAMENLVPVRCSLHFKQRGNAGLRQYLFKVLLLGGVPLGLFLLIVGVFGTQLLRAAYGDAYVGFGYLVGLQALYFAISFLWRLLMFWRRTWEQASIISLSSFASALVAVGFTAATVASFGDKGVMWGLISGVVVAALILLVWRKPQRDPVES